MLFRKKPPKTDKVQAIIPYHLNYDGKVGYAQVVGRVEKKFVAIIVNNPDFSSGKVSRIMKVVKRKFFSDFGGVCTGLDIKATGFILSG